MHAPQSLQIVDEDAPRILKRLNETSTWLNYVAAWQKITPAPPFREEFTRNWGSMTTSPVFRSPLAAPSRWLCNWGDRADWGLELSAMQQRRQTILLHYSKTVPIDLKIQNQEPPAFWALQLASTMGEELFCWASGAYFDPFDLPPWDTWVDYYPRPAPEPDRLLFLIPADYRPQIEPLLLELDTYDFFESVQCIDPHPTLPNGTEERIHTGFLTAMHALRNSTANSSMPDCTPLETD